MAINFFGPVRLTLGSAAGDAGPEIRACRQHPDVGRAGEGAEVHGVHLLEDGASTRVSRIAGRETWQDNVTFTNMRLSLVRTGRWWRRPRSTLNVRAATPELAAERVVPGARGPADHAEHCRGLGCRGAESAGATVHGHAVRPGRPSVPRLRGRPPAAVARRTRATIAGSWGQTCQLVGPDLPARGARPAARGARAWTASDARSPGSGPGRDCVPWRRPRSGW